MKSKKYASAQICADALIFIELLFDRVYYAVITGVKHGGHIFIFLYARTCRYEFTYNYVLFKTDKRVNLILDSRVGKNSCRFLEGRRGKE